MNNSPGLAELLQARGDLGCHVTEWDAALEPSGVSGGEGADLGAELAHLIQLRRLVLGKLRRYGQECTFCGG